MFSNSQQITIIHNQLSITLGQKCHHGEITSKANIVSSIELALLTKAVDKGKPLPKLTRRSA